MKNRIKELRRSKKLTQEEFADKIFLKKSAISAYENGTREVPDRVINNICSAFNVNKNWLVNGTGDMMVDLTDDTNFDEEVKMLLRKIQTLDDKDKQAIEHLINTLYEKNLKKED
ncbi:MAG: helix-turn-helix transcriptional regulator [Paeniclostridium sordellii]|nr:helix-turn-helix transcriptional regulator [Paeniclostridium sordellii]